MNAPQPTPRFRPDDATVTAITAELQKRFGDRVVTNLAVREQHGHTLTWVENQPPDAVVYPQTTAGGVGDRQALRRASSAGRSPSAPAPRSKAMSTRPTAASRSIPA